MGDTLINGPRRTWSTYIYYEDTDFSGYVYHANYLKFFERAREHYIGIARLQGLYADGLQFVVHKVQIQYHIPAVHGDLVTVTSTGSFSQGVRHVFQHELHRDGVLLVDARIELASIRSSGRPRRLPPELARELSTMAPKD